MPLSFIKSLQIYAKEALNEASGNIHASTEDNYTMAESLITSDDAFDSVSKKMKN